MSLLFSSYLEKYLKTKRIKIQEEDISTLENNIDIISEKLPKIDKFIIPGGHQKVSYCHIARSVCRRAERGVTLLSSKGEKQEIAIQFLNRLSDYLFVLSRKILQENNITETYWK